MSDEGIPPPRSASRIDAATVIARYKKDFAGRTPIEASYPGSMWHIVALSHLIIGDIDTMLKEADLSAADLFVMAVMLIEGDARLRPSDIARVLSVTPAAISLRIAKLAQSGFIERQADERDRRTTRLTLTRRGADTVRSLLAKVTTESAFARSLSKLTPDDGSQLETRLSALNDEMARHILKA